MTTAIDWSGIDTVLLDMDGTLLDLRFDNWFWQDVVPEHYARRSQMPLEEARAALRPKFRACMGTLDWYCIDYWSRELDLDIEGIKRSVHEEIRFLPGAQGFLGRLGAMGKRRVLVTNSHPRALAIKRGRVPFTLSLDAEYSTHPFGLPKENPLFWPKLIEVERFDPERTLFVDDNLAVLRSARTFGIRWLRAVRLPDTGRPARDTADFEAVDAVSDLLG